MHIYTHIIVHFVTSSGNRITSGYLVGQFPTLSTWLLPTLWVQVPVRGRAGGRAGGRGGGRASGWAHWFDFCMN